MTTDPRFPAGKFHAPDSYTDASRAAAVAAIAALPANVRKAVSGLSDTQLDTPYRDGGWTVRQVVHHLADSHANAYIRMKFARTEDKPTVKPYDEAVWAELPDAKTGDVEWSLSILDGMHARWSTLLRSFSAAEFARVWVHPEYGERNLDWMTEIYAWHSRHHTAHITELRKKKDW
ncbi:MAG: putative metal-dependent hydrolase [Gemmatimonadetes bacterium]|nr:putative metal-dependent hydrolase [Gemmatimonadota bacterium]